ncbi:MAG: hypothetical protein BWX84_00263 [Verrucomicrobia bacterium ADurb.Bin118]|jgi:hypothetical protein|nr:MAG: hypothetical protein BWX84_00263 [Verrucomicrobia bacterium ADurb.Bin118]
MTVFRWGYSLAVFWLRICGDKVAPLWDFLGNQTGTGDQVAVVALRQPPLVEQPLPEQA